VIASQAVLIAIDWNGRGPSTHGLDPCGQLLAIELADRESRNGGASVDLSTARAAAENTAAKAKKSG
jgi:hypothetical protein